MGQRESCCNLCQKVYCGWQILNHWTIKEVPAWSLLAFLLSPSFSYFHGLFSVFLLASPPFNLSIFFCFFFFLLLLLFLSFLIFCLFYFLIPTLFITEYLKSPFILVFSFILLIKNLLFSIRENKSKARC